jgi:hypothetical protein
VVFKNILVALFQPNLEVENVLFGGIANLDPTRRYLMRFFHSILQPRRRGYSANSAKEPDERKT